MPPLSGGESPEPRSNARPRQIIAPIFFEQSETKNRVSRRSRKTKADRPAAALTSCGEVLNFKSRSTRMKLEQNPAYELPAQKPALSRVFAFFKLDLFRLILSTTLL